MKRGYGLCFLLFFANSSPCLFLLVLSLRGANQLVCPSSPLFDRPFPHTLDGPRTPEGITNPSYVVIYIHLTSSIPAPYHQDTSTSLGSPTISPLPRRSSQYKPSRSRCLLGFVGWTGFLLGIRIASMFPCAIPSFHAHLRRPPAVELFRLPMSPYHVLESPS